MGYVRAAPFPFSPSRAASPSSPPNYAFPSQAIFFLWDWTTAFPPYFDQCTLTEFMELPQESHLLKSESVFTVNFLFLKSQTTFIRENHPSGTFNRSPIKLFSQILMKGSESQYSHFTEWILSTGKDNFEQSGLITSTSSLTFCLPTKSVSRWFSKSWFIY
jgi:hypothetical protein